MSKHEQGRGLNCLRALLATGLRVEQSLLRKEPAQGSIER